MNQLAESETEKKDKRNEAEKKSIELQKAVKEIKKNVVKESNLLDRDEIDVIFARQQETSIGMWM